MTEAKVTCTSCGKQYRCKPEMAGRSVRCKCGSVIRIPDAAAPEPEPAGDAGPLELSLADEGPSSAVAATAAGARVCPNCRTSLVAGAILCVQCGMNLKTGKAIGSAEENARLEAELARRDWFHHRKQREIPILILLLGLALHVMLAWQVDPGATIGGVVTLVMIETAVGVSLMIAGCFLAAKLLDTNFGSLGSAAEKLAGSYVFSGAIGLIVGGWIDPDFGWMLVWPLEVGLFFGLLMWLFELDAFETCVLAGIFILIKHGAMILVTALIYRYTRLGPADGSSESIELGMAVLRTILC